MEKLAHKIEEKERTSDITLKDDIPFSKMHISDSTRKGLSNAGFIYPTNIQANSIPLGKAGIDLLIQSKSGTGKTLIFCVILLEAYKSDIREPQSLIISPTREIAVQTELILNEIGKCFQGFKVVSIIGGLGISEDRKKIQGAKAIVGTPGRILHLINNDILNTSRIRLLILDEADKLMSQTFRQDFEKIIKFLPPKKQMIACSATFCDDLDKELAKYMHNPLLISTEKRATLLIGIKQFVYELPEEINSVAEMTAKVTALNKIFSKISFKQCLAFACSQSRAESYQNMLQKNEWPCEMISGAQDQKFRLEIFKKFREFKTRILISTDLMSRGIDSENVNLVINLEIPESGSTYLHRIGRAGRFGSHGIAITFVCSTRDKRKFSHLLDSIGDNMAVLKFPTDDIPDLWNFSNLNEEQERFGLFEKVVEESKENLDNNNIETNGVNFDNLKVKTDSFSSSSHKQISTNATTLDDASSLAVDSDTHLDMSNIEENRSAKKSGKHKSGKSKERKKKLNELQCFEAINQEQQQDKTTKVSQTSGKSKHHASTKENEIEPGINENFGHLKDDSYEGQSGNSSGGDTRTIIDFKSLVVDKEQINVKPVSSDIFNDYETFKETDVVDSFYDFDNDEDKNGKKTEEDDNQQISIASQSFCIEYEPIVTQNDKSIATPNLPKAPHPSPKDLKSVPALKFQTSDCENNQQFNNLQVQNLPSFDLPPRNNHPELETSDEDDFISTSTSSTSGVNARSSGFDEKTTSLNSSGIVTSSEYSETESSYVTSDEDDEEYDTTSEEEEDISSNLMNQFSINQSDNEDVKQCNSIVNENPSSQVVEISNSNDLNSRYQQAHSLWTNIYWNQLTQIRDYANFTTYVQKNARKI